MSKPTSRGGFTLLVASDSLGRGDNDLGRLLMERFLHEIGGTAELPETVIFVNAGVKLVTGDSPVLDHLRRLDESGVELLACMTCLQRFDLIDEVAVGVKSDMRSIVETLTRSTRVISV
jgi:selenium metabolism protein YedF